MGNLFVRVLDALSGTKEKRILLLGLDAGGKTTILYKLNIGETVHTIPTIGFNVESVRYKNLVFTYWDVGGQEKIRKLWYHYFAGTDAVIFVIDANDTSRIEEAKRELYGVMDHDELRHCPVLIYANKQDLPQSITPSEMTSKLELASRMRGHQWQCQGAVAVSGEGLYEGLDWLAATLQNQPQKH